MDYTRDKWLAYIASQDDNPLPSDSNYQMHIKAVNEYFDQESKNGILHMERLTVVYSEKINDI